MGEECASGECGARLQRLVRITIGSFLRTLIGEYLFAFFLNDLSGKPFFIPTLGPFPGSMLEFAEPDQPESATLGNPISRKQACSRVGGKLAGVRCLEVGGKFAGGWPDPPIIDA